MPREAKKIKDVPKIARPSELPAGVGNFKRCCRWLLLTHDRVGADEFPLTHEFLSQMLGVRRAGVSEVAAKLQNAGFISYKYGKISIQDRVGLEVTSCECYALIKAESDRLIGGNSMK